MSNIKSYFPIFKNKKNLIYLDSAGTSLKPKIVIEKILEYYEKYSINNHSRSENKTYKKLEKIIDSTRKIIAKRINSDKKGIFFTPSATYSLNIIALSLKKYLNGGKIILSKLEHSSNLYPWENIVDKKNKIIFFDLKDNFSINTKNIDEKIDNSVRIATFFHVSNSTGSINDVMKITKKIKKKNPECLVIVDACQSISWNKIDVKKWKIDFLVFSGHKVFGPTGIGVVWINNKISWKISDIFFGGGKKKSPFEKKNEIGLKERIEVGTLPLAQIFGLKGSFEFMNHIEKEKNIDENCVAVYALKKIKELKKIKIYNDKTEDKLIKNIIIFNIPGINAHDLVNYLGKKNILARSGNFCCPYLKEIIGVSAAVRLSISLYNDKSDIKKLIYHLKKIIENPEVIIKSIF